MDGNPERQTQRDELHRVREKIPHRPTDSKTVRRITAASGVHTVGAKANKAGCVQAAGGSVAGGSTVNAELKMQENAGEIL